MGKVIKYKIYYLLSNKLTSAITFLLFIIMNFDALINSGVLLSGGSGFNSELKYELLLNNYVFTASIFGLLVGIYIGSSMIGPDIQTGNMYIILTSFPSRAKYFFGTFIAVVIYLIGVQLLLILNAYILLLVFNIPYLMSDLIYILLQIILNSTVALSLTGISSIYIKGHGSAMIGFLGYVVFNIYMYNVIPFFNMGFIFDLTQYRNIICHIFPITHVLAPSYTEQWIIDFYRLTPLTINIYIYQLLYIIGIVGIGALLFKRKEL